MAVAICDRGRLSPGIAPMKMGKQPLAAKPTNSRAHMPTETPWAVAAAKGAPSATKQPISITGLRPIRSDSAGMIAPKISAEKPTLPISLAVVAGLRPASSTNTTGRKA